MGDVGVFLLSMMIVLMVGSLVLGWINYKISKLKDEIDDVYVGKENAAAAIVVLEGLIWNLNTLCKDHQKRLDILEAGHPDDEIDYGTVDDDGNITEVWFEGKRYVPEDKRNDIDYAKTYGDGNILAVWFHGKKYVPEDKRDEDPIVFYADGRVVAETTRPEEKLVLYKTYKGIISDDKTEELLKRVKDLNYFYNVDLMSTATYMHRWEELTHNDS